MHFSWLAVTSLGHLSVTAPLFGAVAAWLAMSGSRRRALAWCLLFGSAMLIVIASKMAFIGWGVGSKEWEFTGFSGHAARAAAVFPVLAFCLTRGRAAPLRMVGMGGAILLAALVAVSRVMIGTHSWAEVIFGAMLGAAVTLVFVLAARALPAWRPSPLLVGVTLGAMLLQPGSGSISAHQVMTGVTLNLSGHDREYLRWSFAPSRHKYRPPCPPASVHFNYICL